jgi:hypothetical protein
VFLDHTLSTPHRRDDGRPSGRKCVDDKPGAAAISLIASPCVSSLMMKGEPWLARGSQLHDGLELHAISERVMAKRHT